MVNPELRFLFPLGILISILAISSGINGSNFLIPVYIIWLGFDAKTAFWLGSRMDAALVQTLVQDQAILVDALPQFSFLSSFFA